MDWELGCGGKWQGVNQVKQVVIENPVLNSAFEGM